LRHEGSDRAMDCSHVEGTVSPLVTVVFGKGNRIGRTVGLTARDSEGGKGGKLESGGTWFKESTGTRSIAKGVTLHLMPVSSLSGQNDIGQRVAIEVE